MQQAGAEPTSSLHLTRYNMKLRLSQAVLRKLLTAYLTQKETLTQHEQNLAERVCTCTLCEHLWVRRIKRIPTRCPKCARTSWNRPMLEYLIASDTSNQTESANKPRGAA